MAGAGLACLAACILIGLAVNRRETWLDGALLVVAKHLVSRHGVLVRALGGEAYWPHGAYLTALLPLAVTVAALIWEAPQHGVVATIDRWRWVLLTLAAIPVHYALRMVFARPGPAEGPDQIDSIGAYPSGTALAVGLGWGLCLVVVGRLRPQWRPYLVILAVIALLSTPPCAWSPTSTGPLTSSGHTCSSPAPSCWLVSYDPVTVASRRWWKTSEHWFPRFGLLDIRGAASARQLLDQLQLLSESAGGQVVLAHAAVGVLAHAPRGLGSLQQPLHRGAEGCLVGGVVQQQAAVAVDDLVLDAADVAGHHRPRLPHRLGHRQSEAFRQALLHDHVGAALQGVDHGAVLLHVVHGQARHVDPLALGGWQLLEGAAHLAEHRLALRVVADGIGRRSGQHQVGTEPVVDVPGEAPQDTERVLERVPA